MNRDKINVLKYNTKTECYEMLYNAYYMEDNLEVYISNNYKLVIRDDNEYQIIDLPDNISIEEVQCSKYDTKLLFIRLVLKDNDIPTKWIDNDEK